MGVLDAEYQRMYDLKNTFRAVSQTNQRAYRHHSELRTAQKGRTITGFSFKFKQKKKTEAETPKNSDSSPHIKKPSQIPTNIVKQPENAKKDDLGHRASKITGLIMSMV